MSFYQRTGDPNCETCHGEGRIDLNANWHGPPGVERHHWHPCPDCEPVVGSEGES